MKPEEQKQQKLAADTRMLKAWRRWHREQLDEALAGPHGTIIAELVRILGALELRSSRALLEFARRTDWDAIPYDARLIALHEVNITITRLRERSGLPPFDDGIWGAPPNVFRAIKAIVTADSRHNGNA
jgi:hypothetical protein